MCHFRTPYSKAVRAPSHGILFTEPSQTDQSSLEETTIDYYLRRYAATGIDPAAGRLEAAQFGDFSSIDDFRSAQTKVAAVRSGFESLTAQERAQFDNNFSNYVEFILNPENAKAAQDMGFLHAPIVEGMKDVKENQPVKTNAAEVSQPPSSDGEKAPA
nr:MAG TPA: Scaffold protein [Microviridae sp.]